MGRLGSRLAVGEGGLSLGVFSVGGCLWRELSPGGFILESSLLHLCNTDKTRKVTGPKEVKNDASARPLNLASALCDVDL